MTRLDLKEPCNEPFDYEAQAAAELREKQNKEMWDALVFRTISAARGKKSDDELVVPAETGRYIKFARDKHGRYSTPKVKGRLKPRRGALSGVFAAAFQKNFGQALQAAFAHAMAHKEEGKEVSPISQATVQAAQNWAMAKTHRDMRNAAKLKSRSLRLRQEASRRINTGLDDPRSERRNCAQGRT
jgi:hypothetical protein